MIKLVKSTFYKEKETKNALCSFIKGASQLSFGSMCEKFEKDFSVWQGRGDTIAVNSGSSANLAMIQTLLNLGKIRVGDEVGFSSVTWSTNVMPLVELGLKPVPIDVEISTLNISPLTVSQAWKKKKFKLLILTNLLGFCDDVSAIASFCKEKCIIFIEDNCESLGSVYKKKKLGNFGLMSSFSFYVGHHMSTIEGGAICTDNEKIATMLRLVRAHGWDRNLSFTKQNEIRNKFKINSTFYSRYTFYDLGYNLRPTEIVGYIGNQQLKYIDEVVSKRQENFFRFARAIYTCSDKYYPVTFDHMDLVSNFAVPVVCKSTKIRDTLVSRCQGIVEIRPIVGGNMIAQPFFRKYIKNGIKNCVNAKKVHLQGLYFGNNPELTNKEIQTIIKIFTG
jgi:CDP-6-deoxy-D-xylo-4-hexulose-3-dehydrase